MNATKYCYFWFIIYVISIDSPTIPQALFLVSGGIIFTSLAPTKIVARQTWPMTWAHPSFTMSFHTIKINILFEDTLWGWGNCHPCYRQFIAWCYPSMSIRESGIYHIRGQLWGAKSTTSWQIDVNVILVSSSILSSSDNQQSRQGGSTVQWGWYL